MSRSKQNIYVVVIALTVPLFIAGPVKGQGATSGVNTTDGATATPAPVQEDPALQVKPKKVKYVPGQPLVINTTNETIKVTNDAKLAKAQVDNFPDSPEAHFVLAVALTRTSQVEEALKEVRTARKLSTQKGGPSYFDNMIEEYETMLKNSPEDNQIRYHLAWAYYMKAYVLARYSKPGTPKTPPAVAAGIQPAAAAVEPRVDATAVSAKPDAAQSTDATKIASAAADKGYTNLGEEPEEKKPAFTPPAVPPANAPAHAGAGNNFWSNPLGSLQNLGPITGMEYATANAVPELIPQIKSYYRRSLQKLDEVLERQPDDLWATLYRAHLRAEYSGDIDSAMTVWESCKQSNPNNPAPYFFLGEGYLKKGNLQQCLNNVSKAIALRSIGN